MFQSTSDPDISSGQMWTLTGSIGKKSPPFTVRVDRTPFRVGRRPDVELSLASPVVSGTHVLLMCRGETLWVRDADSTNGTYLNGTLIKSEAQIADGDWIEFGDATFRINRLSGDGPSSDFEFDSQKTSDFCGINGQLAVHGLNELLRTRALAACFQPIYVLADNEIYGYEFLARSAVSGVSNPAAMFAAAEATGQEIRLSELCRECAIDHSLTLPSTVPVFLNTHPREDLINGVLPQLQDIRSRYPRRILVLEIHEAAVTESEMIRELRHKLAAVNVGLAFDDYGAGQARFRELICAPSDYIKFDTSLIHDLMDVDQEQREFFRTIINRIRTAGAMTIAEGVETEEMALVCREMGFDLVQGFLFGRPAIMASSDRVTMQVGSARITEHMTHGNDRLPRDLARRVKDPAETVAS